MAVWKGRVSNCAQVSSSTLIAISIDAIAGRKRDKIRVGMTESRSSSRTSRRRRLGKSIEVRETCFLALLLKSRFNASLLVTCSQAQCGVAARETACYITVIPPHCQAPVAGRSVT